MAAVRTEVQVDGDFEGVPSREKIQDWVGAAIEASGKCDAETVEVAVRIVDAGEMRALNSRYRHREEVTNVLSFEAGDIAGLPDDAPRALGDVVVCATVVAAEAAAQGKALENHWGHLLVHGTLHLLGFDHQTRAEAAEMEALEIRVLAAKHVPDPYASES